MAHDPHDFVDIRLSDLLRDCSVGAIVRHGRTLMVVQDTRYWDGPETHPHDREIHYADLVKRSLNLEATKLCRPPERRKVGEHIRGWVPARRFPEWTRCNRCELLHNAPWRGLGGNGNGDGRRRSRRSSAAAPPPQGLDCTRTESSETRQRGGKAGRCGGTLEQVPWVLVHENGYLADVPWHAIAHDGAKAAAQGACKPEWRKPYLRIVNEVGKRFVECGKCRARERLRVPGQFRYGSSTRQQPWVRQLPPEPPVKPGWLVGVNDVRVHFAETRTALVIPPESRYRRGTLVDRLYTSSADRRSIGEARTELARLGALEMIADKYGCERADVERALEELEAGYPSGELPQGKQYPLEYDALTEPIADLLPDEDFVTDHHSEEWRSGLRESGDGAPGVAACVDRLVGVNRVKTIMVLEGFRRGGRSERDSHPPTPPDIVGESDWLPALELLGEGLFFTLDERRLRRWESQNAVRERAAKFKNRSYRAILPQHVEDALSPRFLLCHTLAHLMIRRLEAEAGYPAASLRERIYCGADEENPMAGILIHVAVADEHGSLGGLMEMARPEPFLRLFTGAVEDAAWCSFDPVCAEQEGHGPDLLNQAACHACALVPEPSCVCGNRLLDRVFVAGDGARLLPLWKLEAGGA